MSIKSIKSERNNVARECPESLKKRKQYRLFAAVILLTIIIPLITMCKTYTPFIQFEGTQEGVYITLDDACEIIHYHLTQAGFTFTLLEPCERKEVGFRVDSEDVPNIATLVLVNEEKSFYIAIVDGYQSVVLNYFGRYVHTHRRSAIFSFERDLGLSIDFVFFNMRRFRVGDEEPLIDDVIAWRYEQIQALIELLEYIQEPERIAGHDATRVRIPRNVNINVFKSLREGVTYGELEFSIGRYTGYIDFGSVVRPYYAVGDVFIIMNFTLDDDGNFLYLYGMTVADAESVLYQIELLSN